MSKLIPTYKTLQANLHGWVDVPFAEFRERLWPLCAQRGHAWSQADKDYIAQLVLAGATAALRSMFAGNKTALSVIDEVPPGPELPELSRPTLEAVVGKSLREGRQKRWEPLHYVSLLASFDRGSEELYAQREDEVAFEKARAPSMAEKRRVAAEREEDRAFEKMYRENPLARRCVQGLFATAITSAGKQKLVTVGAMYHDAKSAEDAANAVAGSDDPATIETAIRVYNKVRQEQIASTPAVEELLS